MSHPTPPRDGQDDDEQESAATDNHSGVSEKSGDSPSESNGTLPGGVIPLNPAEPELEPAPGTIGELADACVRFVQAAVGVPLDFRPETLPLLDHYLATRREELLAARAANPEAMGLVARAAAAYFGEVVRRHFRF